MTNPSSRPPAEVSDFRAIFQNRNFTLLWTSQVFGQSAQNAIFFVHMVMIEGLTRSSGLVGLMVLVLNLPGIMFSLPSGLVLDRFYKKSILLFCNVSRIFVVASFILVRRYTKAGELLTAVYVLTFILSTIGQLSDPAEVATVPLIVARDQLLAANSAFHLLFNVCQVVGVMFLAPVAIKIGGLDGAFATISLCYLITTALISLVLVDEPDPNHHATQDAWGSLWREVRAGWQFIVRDRSVLVAIVQHGLINGLTMTIAVLVPGFTARVLGMQVTDAVYIFAAGGLGMFLTAMWIGNVGRRVRREILVASGFLIVGLALAGLTAIAWNVDAAGGVVGQAPQEVIIPVMLMAMGMGIGGTLAVVSAQTIVQERTPVEIRGRVISTEFLFTNLAGLPATLVVASLADFIGIPNAVLGLTILVLGAALFSFRVRRAERLVSDVVP